MNRYRNAPGLRAGPSKATATTLCQKCLKRDIYECKAAAQERPYTARPSRTQQLLNPRLMPKLSTEVPSDFLQTNGVADEILAKRNEERGRKRDLDGDDTREGHSPKRARSLSSHSTNSISTISTNRSASASPDRHSTRKTHSNGDVPGLENGVRTEISAAGVEKAVLKSVEDIDTRDDTVPEEEIDAVRV
ncbi:hypothetical protein N7462_004057 [Penicillium macrosclerotiorum]|uniref:uncharacterized protein n=1 Tax=Penicillium macrosclerotiorum TaxID=303699 RepID=UPI0025483B9A|nr:uncharacterized protein N7462_004057 [Penicillium macrosclerotiorum]KAJ5689665.1 hypothetical protein N7462_004057 [Penicillium macrosclerotiorum]